MQGRLRLQHGTGQRSSFVQEVMAFIFKMHEYDFIYCHHIYVYETVMYFCLLVRKLTKCSSGEWLMHLS